MHGILNYRFPPIVLYSFQILVGAKLAQKYLVRLAPKVRQIRILRQAPKTNKMVVRQWRIGAWRKLLVHLPSSDIYILLQSRESRDLFPAKTTWSLRGVQASRAGALLLVGR